MNSTGFYPSASAFVITPDDNADLPRVVRGIHVGSSGDINMILWDDTIAVVFKNMQTGVFYALQIKRVLQTNTTAANLVGLA